MDRPLELFHPLIREWFNETFGRPTEVQEAAWPVIAAGHHLLATAPTGSGKTLTAFLWAINQLASGTWRNGACRVIYISPLKALNNDIRENLIRPLGEIRERFSAAGTPFPSIRVETRSGDTPQSERRRMSLHPPEILITTPESLNLLLSSRSGRLMLGGIKTVILDEIHACAGTKRGVHLITAVDRLVRLSGEFQRIALSATLKDLSPVQEMVAGYRMSGPSDAPVYEARAVTCIRAEMKKELRVRVLFPEASLEDGLPGEGENTTVWDDLARVLSACIAANRATLIFTNGRRLCEKLTYKINEAAGSLVAFSHHGSLSRELRCNVEKKLKNGELSAIVATSSLEMGIDIGALSEVIMVQSPPSVSSAVQRLGRAGHRVGEISCGTLFPAHAQDLIPSAVLAQAAVLGDIEPLCPVRCPLDVLAQILVSMIGMESWDLTELYAFIRTSAPFHTLSRQRFDLTVDMLAGKYAGTRIRDLLPRIHVDRLTNRAEAAKGALLALYMSGGTIPDRGYFQLRHARTRARIGELDEEYVWEAKKGQIATVGSRNWKITEITHNDVFALPAGNAGVDAPFWLAEAMNRDVYFSKKIGAFLEQVAEHLAGGETGERDLKALLVSDYFMDAPGAAALIAFCRSQERVAALPHKGRIVFEYVRTGPGKSPGTMLVIHTLWGGRVNRPFALALGAAWEKSFGERPEIFPGNDAVVVQLPGPVSADEILSLVREDSLMDLLVAGLETSGFFGGRFRECAGRALLVTRHRAGQRMPLWMSRLKSQKLLENVLGYPDFPILLETLRTCLEDEFDLPGLLACLGGLACGRISCETVHTATPSPFAETMAWQQINQYMYREDQPASKASGLCSDLIRETLYNESLRPKIPADLIRDFGQKRRRLASGYIPESAAELLSVLKERLALPLVEWQIFSATGHNLDNLHDQVVVIRPGPDHPGLVTALENTRELLDAWYTDREDVVILTLSGSLRSEPLPDVPGADASAVALLGQWLGFYGPVTREWLVACLGVDGDIAEPLLFDLADAGQIVEGALVLGQDDEYLCDAGNFEILIRMNRAVSRNGTESLDLDCLPLFLAEIQGVIRPAEGQGRLFDIFEQLSCLPLPAALWETQVLPARIFPYYPAFLDSLMQEGGLLWMGAPGRKILFCLDPDLDFLAEAREDNRGKADGTNPSRISSDVLSDAFDFRSPQSFSSLKARTGLSDAVLTERIWELVWQGRLSNNTALALRRGIASEFRAGSSQIPVTDASAGEDGRWAGISGRSTAQRPWRSGRRAGVARQIRERFSLKGEGLPGLFFCPEPQFLKDMDLVDRQAMERDRVRLLLDRYGILFRELLDREMPQFRWGAVFKTLYLMELSGEVVAGVFFKGIEGPQFASHRALKKLPGWGGRDEVFLIHAMDPASACGLGKLSSILGLPRRVPGNAMVYKGTKLKLVSLRQGRELIIHTAFDDPELGVYLSFMAHAMTRQIAPASRISVEIINGEPAVTSPYRMGLEGVFDVAAGVNALDLYPVRGPGKDYL